MKRIKTDSVRRWVVIVAMSLSTVALGFSGGQSVDAADLCKACGLQCANEAWYYMMECQSNGGSNCSNVYNDYVYNCKSVSCNYGLGCKL